MFKMKTGTIDVPGHSILEIEIVTSLARNGNPHGIRLASPEIDLKKPVVEKGAVIPLSIEGGQPQDYEVVATLIVDGERRHYTVLKYEND